MTSEFASDVQASIADLVWRSAEETPERTSHLFAETGEAFTWRGLRDEAAACAAWLHAEGARPGESVALLAENGRLAVAILFGCWFGGFRVTPLNLVAGPQAVAHAIRHSGARLLVMAEDQRALAEAALALIEEKPRVVFVQDGQAPWRATPPARRSLIPSTAHGLLIYTSGTTGRPKGVLLSQRALIAGGRNTALAHGLTSRDRGLCVLPLYHINGLCVTLLGALVSGGSLILERRFSLSRFWRVIGEHDATWASLVPTIIGHLNHAPPELAPKSATGSPLRFARSASAPLAPESLAAFEARFGIPLIETMGLTETAAQILANPLPPGARKSGSPGVAIGNRVIVAGRYGGEAAVGQEGEILVIGDNLFDGYLDDPVATAKTFTSDGWLRTGDLGRMDEDGFVFVTGRLKELIIKGGENIAPREIDEALLAQPGVIEAAAFAVTCPRYGQRVEAAVVMARPAAFVEAALIAGCVARVGGFKAPDRVHRRDDLPKGPSGKVQRLRLAALLSKTSA